MLSPMRVLLSLHFYFTFCFATLVQAQEEETGYDSLVQELKSTLKEEEPVPAPPQPMHVLFGTALAGDYVSIGGNGSPSGGALLGGFDLHAAIELAPGWLAEATFRSFGSARIARDYAAALQEYDLTLMHQSEFRRHLFFRLGGGLSAQFLKTMDSRNSQYSEGTDQTPALALVCGMERELGQRVSLGPDLSYRTSLSHGTAERGSADASLRMNFHF